MYSIIQPTVRQWINFYFRRYATYNHDVIPQTHPVLFTPNHQNALLDAYNIIDRVEDQVKFMTRADVFKNKLAAKFLASLQMIPIYRSRDVQNTVEANEKVFQLIFSILERRGKVLIFPEANCVPRRQIRPLKKGTARIAFDSYIQGTNCKDLVVLPVGVNYSNHTSFRSDCLVNFGTAITLPKFMDSYNEHPQKALKKLNKEIERQLKELTIHFDDLADEENYMTLFVLVNGARMGFHHGNSSHLRKEFESSKQIQVALDKIKTTDREMWDEIMQETEQYRKMRDQLKLDDYSMYEGGYDFSSFWWALIRLIVGFVPAMFGTLFYSPVHWFIDKVFVKKLSEDQFISSGRFNMTMVGFVLLLFVYSIGSLVLLGPTKWALMAIVALPLTTSFSFPYFELFRTFKRRIKIAAGMRTPQSDVHKAIKMKYELLENMRVLLKDPPYYGN